ncbi:serine/threonine protein kinase, partial [Bacillus spizizenii]|nr:serine/threonine protein kinase [Bacillus spizizenii]
RKRTKGEKRAYSVPLYPFMPILAIAGSFFVLGSTLITDTLSCGLSILIGLAGLPVYYGMKKRKAI